jgi:hypothetical protein
METAAGDEVKMSGVILSAKSAGHSAMLGRYDNSVCDE